MRAIFKYPFRIAETFSIAMPAGAVILSVQYQAAVDGASIWAIVDPTAKPHYRHFQLVGTGHGLQDWMNAETHVATWQQGSFVWHLFEGPPV